MDNYPEHLSPEFDDGGGVTTPFEIWWGRVSTFFPNVPEEVARYWLHEHWNHSPYSYLQSKNYVFSPKCISSNELSLIRSRLNNFSSDQSELIEHGKRLVENSRRFDRYGTPAYMCEHGVFPAAIIVLDNRDGHLTSGIPPVPKYEILPNELFLVEGHRRLNIALFLNKMGIMKDNVNIWLMQKI